MKKLMIAFAVAAVATCVNAASFSWQNSSVMASTKIYQADGTTAVAENTVAYLFCTADITQGTLLTSVRNGDALSKYAISGADALVNSSSKIATKEFSYGDVGGDYTFYYALISGDNVLISDVKSAQGQQGATEAVAFTNSATWSKVDKGSNDYSVAGWYAVPEPTSGLMLLLGVGLMALRRRRA